MREFLRGTVTPKDWAAAAGILAATAGLIVAFYLLLHLHQKSELAQIHADDQLVSSDLHQARRINNEIDALREETGRIEDLVSDFEERLPSGREIPTLLREFEGMAAEEDIDVELSPLARSKDTRKEIIPYSIVARGSYHRVASFINRLERFKRYLKISDLSIQPNDDKLQNPRMQNRNRQMMMEERGFQDNKSNPDDSETNPTRAQFTLNTYRFLHQTTEESS